MKVLVPILIGLVVLGCGKKRLLLFAFSALFASNVFGVKPFQAFESCKGSPPLFLLLLVGFCGGI